MLFLQTLLLAGTAAAVAIPRAAQADVQTNLQTIDSDTKSLLSAEQSYQGGVFQAIPVENAASQLDNDLKSATSDATSGGPVSDDAAQTAIDYVNNTLEPDVSAAVDALIAKKSQVQDAGLTGTVQDTVNNLKNDAQAYGSALTSAAPSDKQSGASAALAKINADLQRAVDAYAS